MDIEAFTPAERELLCYFLEPPTKYVMVPETRIALAEAALTLSIKGWVRALDVRSFPSGYPVYYLTK